jgi:hypothetical protein
MKLRWIVGILVAGALVGGLIFAYLEMSKERERERQREKPVIAKSRVSSGTNGEPVVTLDREMQKRIGLRSERLAPARVTPELKGYGRVLVAAPMAALSLELASAQAALAASEKEFERLKLLHEQKNTSDRAVQAAEAIAQRDRILVETTRMRLVSAWGRALAERSDLNELVRSLSRLESALVRINLPVGETIKTPPRNARIIPLSGDDRSLTVELVGPAPAVDPQMQGQAFLFLIRTNSPGLVPGAAVTGYLEIAGESLDGVIVPDSAVVRNAGRGWVYVQTGGETFERRQIALGHRRDDGWFVRAGVAPNEHVVVNEAQALLSEEQKYQIRMVD